jgi:hypothetical protein
LVILILSWVLLSSRRIILVTGAPLGNITLLSVRETKQVLYFESMFVFLGDAPQKVKRSMATKS